MKKWAHWVPLIKQLNIVNSSEYILVIDEKTKQIYNKVVETFKG